MRRIKNTSRETQGKQFNKVAIVLCFKSAAADLSCATRILNLLLKLWQDMTDDEYIVLEGALTPDVSDNGQQVSQSIREL